MSVDDEIEQFLRNALPANSNKKSFSVLKSLFLKKAKSKKLYAVIATVFALIGTLFYAYPNEKVCAPQGNKSYYTHNPFYKNCNYSRTQKYTHKATSSKSKKYDTKASIGAREQSIYKNAVEKLAVKENKHVNAIHNEMRYKFKFNSYKDIPMSLYNKAIKYIHERLEAPDKTPAKSALQKL